MKKLIPFDRDKYEKGAKVVRRDGKEILDIFFLGEEIVGIFQIFRFNPRCLDACSNSIKGEFYDDEVNDNDLLLEVEAKTIDLWIGLDDQFIGFPNGKVGIHCSTYAYQDKEEFNVKFAKRIVKITLDADTMEQIL